MKNFTDPTYLRSIYDGLSAGSINKDNATALPIGLEGIYEEALPHESNVNERKKFMEFFGVWALLKKEVSVEFVLPLLEGWMEKEVLDYIGRYSKWFNSPAPGKYLLYHFNFRAYLLLRMGNNLIYSLNKDLVFNGEKQSEYYKAYYIDHAYGNAFQEAWAYQFVIDEVLKIEFDNSDTSELQESKHRWFGYAATLLSAQNDELKLKQLYILYDKFLNNGFALEKEEANFKNLGIDYLIRRGDLFQNPNESVLYWVYFLDKIISKKPKNKNSTENSLNDFILHINQHITANPDINANILTASYLEYLNTMLRDNGNVELVFQCDVENEGVTSDITDTSADDGMGYYYGLNNFDTYSRFYFGKFSSINEDEDLNNILDEVDRGVLIKELVRFWFNLGEVKLNFSYERLFKFFENRDGSGLYRFLMDVKAVIESNPDLDTSYFMNFDSFAVELYKLCLKYNVNIEAESILALMFINGYYRNQFSIQLQLYKIAIGGSIVGNYQKYTFGQDPMYNKHKYILNEANCISYILSINNRHTEIHELFGKVLNRLLNLHEYQYEIDLLAKTYCSDNLTKESYNIINIYFKHNSKIQLTNLHIQLSSVLCKKKSLLDLIHFVYFDRYLLSEIEYNFQFVYEINHAVYLKLNNKEYIKYILDGFELYIHSMGEYGLDQFQLQSEMPESNVWELEWWVLCNVYECIQKNPNIKASVKTAIKVGVNKIYELKGLDVKHNLLRGIDEYKANRNLSKYKVPDNFETMLHKDPSHHLKNLKAYIGDKSKVSKIAGSIQNGLV